MKIVLINHSFQQEQFCKRWKTLANEHKDWDITLLAPSEWIWGTGKAVTFGTSEKKRGYEFDSDNYHVKQIHINEHKLVGWTSTEMIEVLCEIDPDCIYHIGSHTQESLMQILDYKKKNEHKVKIFAFSMRGPQQNLSNISELRKYDTNLIKKIARYFQYLYEKKKVKKLNSLCDAIFCHYPDGMQCFLDEGYSGPIFMQTQVGVDVDVFYPDSEKRKQIREQYGIKDSTYVFASAVRFNPSKGVLKVLEALPVDGDWKYLLMGSGLPDEVKAIERKIDEKGIKDKVILPGFVKWEDMAGHWNASDCAIHFTQTTSTWVETFSLSLVQAMATELPVIGSTSGSVPYQIGPEGIIVDENDVKMLNQKIEWILQNKDEGINIGKHLYGRTIRSFSTRHLNKLFYKTVSDLLNDKYEKDDIDMANTLVE